MSQAQTADDQSAALQDIIVTGTRTGATASQNVAASISAFDSETLRQDRLERIEDLQGVTTGLQVSDGGAGLYIRGVGTNMVFAGSDPSTSVYVDGVYIARPSATLQDFADPDRIEVFKGPQGTLYGRNSAGGAINILTKLPGDAFHADATAEYGSDNRLRAVGTVGGPVIDGVLGLSASFIASRRDGLFHNDDPFTAVSGLDDEGKYGGRLAARLYVTDRLEIQAILDGYESDTHPFEKQSLLAIAPEPGTSRGVGTVFNPNHATVVSDPYADYFPYVGRAKTATYGATVKALFKVTDELDLTSISAWRGLDSKEDIDTDYSDYNEEFTRLFERQRQWSQELTANWKHDGLNVVGGFYFFHEDYREAGTVSAPFLVPVLQETISPFVSSLGLNVDGTLVDDSYAGYGQASYEIIPTVTLTAGLRYSYEEKSLTNRASETLGFVIPQIPPVVIPAASGIPQKADFHSVTPKFGIDWRPIEDVLLYFSATKGFKAGGFNYTTEQPAFQPENIWAYEIGVKSEWLDRRLQVDAAGFYYDYSDLQVSTVGTPTLSNPTPGLVISNAASARILGAELQTKARVTDALTVSGGATYLDATYGTYDAATTECTRPGARPAAAAPGTCLVNVAGNQLDFAPRWQAFAAADYVIEQPFADITLHADYRFNGRTYFNAFNDPFETQGSYGLLFLRLSALSKDGRWEASAFGNNVTDQRAITGVSDFLRTGLIRTYREPALWGVQVTYRY